MYAWMLCVFTVIMAYSITCPIIVPFGKFSDELWALCEQDGHMWETWKAQFCILIPVQMLIMLRAWIQVSFPSCGKTGQKMVNYLALVLPLEVESIFNVY